MKVNALHRYAIHRICTLCPCLLPAKTSKHLPTPKHSSLFFQAHLVAPRLITSPANNYPEHIVSGGIVSQDVPCQQPPLRWKPQLQGFNSKKRLCTYNSHLTKVPLWTPSKILQQQGNSDTGELLLTRKHHSRENSIHTGLWPNPHAPIPEVPKKEIQKKVKPASYFDGIHITHKNHCERTSFLFWAGIVKVREGPTLQVLVQKCPVHLPCILLQVTCLCPDPQKRCIYSFR